MAAPITYDSMSACCSMQNVDKRLLKAAKSQGFPGFRNGKVVWTDELKSWCEANKNNNLTIDAESNLQKVKLQNLIKDGVLKDLQIKQKEENLIEQDEVYDLLETIAKIQMGLFNKISKELSLKISGKTAGEIEEQLNKSFAEIVDAFKVDLNKYIDTDE